MPGFFALPVINTFTSLISLKLIKTSVPMYAEFTFDFTNDEASPKDIPAIITLPISSKEIDPSPSTIWSLILSF